MTNIRLNALGPVAVVRDGTAAPITQPRLLALIAYLVLARPRGRYTRDTLIALLWPDADQASGRQGLRNALYRLRHALGEDVIQTVGENFVEVTAGAVDSDVFTFERAVDEQRWSDAVAAYRGEFLQGFHVSDAPAFERWLDVERERLTTMAIDAAWEDVTTRRESGDVQGAIRAAAFACGLKPDDERSIRRYLELLRDAGDPAAARRAYDLFAARLKSEFDATPSPETAAVLDAPPSPAPHVATRQAPVPVSVSARLEAPLALQSPSPGRRWSGIGLIAAALALVSIPVTWQLAASSDAPATDAFATGAILDERWRKDTALLARYLRGRWQLRSGRNSAAARDTFYGMTRDAPMYAPGWAGLALATVRSGFFDIPPRDAINAGVTAAHRALHMDSTLKMAREALINAALFGDWDLPATKVLLDSALARYPDDPELLNLLATWYRWRGDFDQSLAIKQANAQNDPLSTVSMYQVVPSLYFSRRCTEAVTAFRRLPQEMRGDGRPTMLLASLLCAGMRDDVARVLRDEALTDDSSLVRLFIEPLTAARSDSVIELVMRRRINGFLARRREEWLPPERLMLHYAFRRHADSTLMWLDSMVVERSMMAYAIPFDPLMDFLRADRRFDAILQRLTWISDLAPAQQQLIDSLRRYAGRR